VNIQTETMIDADMRIRWGIKRDMNEVLTIENECFAYPWSESDFDSTLRQRNCIIKVAEIADCVAAYAVCDLNSRSYRLLNFAVRADLHRRGVGSQLLTHLKGKLNVKRPVMLVDVWDRNIGGQLFFRSQGFRAVAIVAGPYRDNADDAYQFRYSLPDCRGK